MKFSIDMGDRFQLVSKEGGWDLIVDDETVFYCHHPVEAVRFLGEKLREEDVAKGASRVVEALASVQKEVERAVEVVNLNRAAQVIVPIIMRLSSAPVDRREAVKIACLKLADCSLAEFHVREDKKEIVTKVKAMLEPWFEIQGI
jgi:hypothetical protein